MKKLLSALCLCFICSSLFFTLEGEKNWWYEFTYEWQINKTISIIGRSSLNNDISNFTIPNDIERVNTIGIQIKF
jgi:hypothetical protein